MRDGRPLGTGRCAQIGFAGMLAIEIPLGIALALSMPARAGARRPYW